MNEKMLVVKVSPPLRSYKVVNCPCKYARIMCRAHSHRSAKFIRFTAPTARALARAGNARRRTGTPLAFAPP